MRSVIVAVCLLSHVALAQTPQFEAATVKRRTEPGGGFIGRQPGGRFAAQGTSLRDLLVFAYGVQSYQVVTSTRWIETDRWDIAAVGAPATPADVLIALQQLLADRFRLVVRREQRDLPVYALVPARSDRRPGPRLKASATDCEALKAEAGRTHVTPAGFDGRCYSRGRAGSIELGGSRLTEFTQLLSGRLQRTVIDRTGLSGPWDLTLSYTPEPAQIAVGAVAAGDQPAFDPNGASLFTAVTEQLGLKLEAIRAAVEVLVIDRAEVPNER